MDTIERAIDRLNRAEDLGEELSRISVAEPAIVEVLDSAASSGDAVEENLSPAPTSVTQRQVTIDLDRLGAMGFVVPGNDRARTHVASEFRGVKRPLLKKAFASGRDGNGHSNMIMVTSAQPGEGKTFVSVNLAISIAMEMDTTVLLVDCDVVKPSVSAVLDLPQGPGLVDYLLGGCDSLSDVLMATNIPKLTILPAGRAHSNSTELLHSDNMRKLTEEMARRYSDRIVLFDTPPLLATTEAAVVAGMMGQVVMVVDAENTPREMVKDAIELIDASRDVSFILNKSRRPGRSASYYGYGSSYGE